MATYLTGDAAADELLDTDPLALLLGMVLDQQVRYPCDDRPSPAPSLACAG